LNREAAKELRAFVKEHYEDIEAQRNNLWLKITTETQRRATKRKKTTHICSMENQGLEINAGLATFICCGQLFDFRFQEIVLEQD
jgi:hypothetical protein